MKLTLKEAQTILQKEIDWCKANPKKGITKIFRNGFCAGLKQAQYLLEKAEESIKST